MNNRIGAGGIFAVIVGIITLGGLVSVGLLRKTMGTVLIMLVGIYAVSNVKGDFFDLIKNYNTRSEAADIRRLEFEREKMKLEAETQLKTLELEAKRTEAERQAKERERIRYEKLAAAEAKQKAELEIQSYVNKTLMAEGFSFLEKNNFQEIHYKFLPTRYNGPNKIIALETIVSRNELTTSSKDLKWRSQRYNLEINCWQYMVKVTNAHVYDGPLTTGNLVASTEQLDWMEPQQWQKNWGTKWCATQ